MIFNWGWSTRPAPNIGKWRINLWGNFHPLKVRFIIWNPCTQQLHEWKKNHLASCHWGCRKVSLYTPSQSILLSRKVNVYLEGTLWRGRTRDRGSVLGAIPGSAWWQVENQLYSSVWTDANIQTLWKGPSIGQRPRRCVAFFAMSLTSLT